MTTDFWTNQDRARSLARLQIHIREWIGDHLGSGSDCRDVVALDMARVALAVWENDRDTYPQKP